jgi:hypothetical protein
MWSTKEYTKINISERNFFDTNKVVAVRICLFERKTWTLNTTHHSQIRT